MGRDADVVGGEPGVELEGSARGHRLGAAVAEALERKSSVGEGLLLLELGLDVVEGREKKDAKKPAMDDAPSVAVKPVMPFSFIISLAWSLDASMPMLSAMARMEVVPAPVKRPPMPSFLTVSESAWTTPV